MEGVMIQCYESECFSELLFSSKKAASSFVAFLQSHASAFGAICGPVANEESSVVVFACSEQVVVGAARFTVSTPPSRPEQVTPPQPGALAYFMVVEPAASDTVSSALLDFYTRHRASQRVDRVMVSGAEPKCPDGWVKKQTGLLVRVPRLLIEQKQAAA
jgi:hypothetical protein